MAVQLTQGAVERMCSGDTEIKPLLQVTDIRLVSSSNQTSTNERYRMLLSDGIYTQQGMLATQRNDLVKSGKLQKGSIVQLIQFVCNLIQNRKIIIVIDLDLVHEQCDLIGQPSLYVLPGGVGAGVGAGAGAVARPAQIQSSAETNTTSGNMQYGNNYYPRLTGGGGPALQPPKMERGPELQSHGSPYASNLNTGRFSSTSAASMHPRPGFAPGGSAGTEVSHGPPVTRPPQPVYQQPSSMYTNRGPIAKNEAAPRIIPIAALNPYQGRWTIKARVTAKSELRRYSNPRGDGKVFSFDLLDSDGGEIRVTCFNAVADQFFEQIEVGKVYLISKGSLKPAQKNFNHLRNDHEVFLESTSIVQACFDDDSSIPKQQFHFRPISDVEGMENNSIVDIIGIVSSINPSSTIMRKNNTETQKRTLQLKDTSGKGVELVLWGNFCNAEGQELQTMCDSGRFPVLAVKAVRVNDFNGKAVGTLSTSQLFIEPDFTEARTLKEWFEREGRNTPCISISRDSSSISRTDVRKTVSQIKDEKLGTSEKPDYITVCAHITFVKVENFCYTACPLMVGERKCSKKVINNGDGKWHCDRCDRSVDECEYRYILQCQIQDHTALTWVTAFQEMGEQIMGLSAKELYYMKYEEQDDEKFNEAIYRVLFSKYIFKLKVKEETFSDEQRVKSTVMKADRVNFSSEARFLADLMIKLKTEGSNPPVVAASSYVTGQSAAPPLSYGANAGLSSRETGVSANQTAPYGNQYGGSGYPSGNTSGVTYASCSSCGGTGHSAANCPSVMSGPGQLSGGYGGRTNSGSEECYKCHQTGHWARDCPGSSLVQSGPGSFGAGGGGGECYKCHQTGHWARDCPGSGVVQSGSGSIGGGGAGGASGECYKCHQFGHWARDCPGISSVPPAYGMQKQHLGGY